MVKRILVTGIGGNVAHGVLRNILNLKIKAFLVGIDVKKVSAGNHLCDKVYQVPFSSSADYIPAIIKICKKDSIDLIIPTTDAEVYYLAKVKEKLPTIAASDAEIAHTFLNKYKTYLAFKKFNIPFAETKLPSEYKNDFKEIIVKPMEGTGSKGILINPKNPHKLPDDYVIQKLYKGEEITTGFYVTKDRKLLGFITFKRSLYHGTSTICEVTSRYDTALKKLVKRMVRHFDIKGSCDIQSIATEDGKVMPFEVNCRLSGTNSIRGEFGFEDVRYAIDEYLFNKKPKKPSIKKGSSIKIWVDVVYPNISLDKIKDRSTRHYIVKHEK